jgi:hypothetical protein
MNGVACKGEKWVSLWGHTGWKVETRYRHDIELSRMICRENGMVVFRFQWWKVKSCLFVGFTFLVHNSYLLDSHFLFTILSSLGYVLFSFHPSLALIGHLAVCVFLYSSSALSSSSLQPKRWKESCSMLVIQVHWMCITTQKTTLWITELLFM